MHIDEEIAGTAELVALDGANALERLASASGEFAWDAKTTAHYRNFIDGCMSVATSILAACRDIAGNPDVPPHAAKQAIESLLLRAHEATHAMFLGMLVIEHLASPDEKTAKNNADALARRASQSGQPALVKDLRSIGKNISPPDNDTTITCSFCGKPNSEAPVVAAPVGGICAACTRLAATIHGIELRE